jgi:diguanylate cyclase (GGDEF)-like protein
MKTGELTKGTSEGHCKSLLIRDVSLVFAVVYAASLFGIFTRAEGFLASIWPANALLLGIFIRKRRLASPLGWLIAFIAYFAADMVTGGSVRKTLMLTTANLAGVATGYILFLKLPVEDRFLRRPVSVLYFFLVCVAAAISAGIVGGVAGPSLFGHSFFEDFAFWFTSEFVNSTIVLPLVLTTPKLRYSKYQFRKSEVRFGTLGVKLIPLGTLILSLIASLVVGGPGSFTFPLPALLWCALSYSLFSTALLTMGLCMWKLVDGSADFLLPVSSGDYVSYTTSIRFGIALFALGPLMVASINASRNELIKILERAAHYDFLTNALSRGAFHAFGNKMLAQLAAEKQPLAVVMLDIDHFKSVNDRYGHAVGDLVLTNFTQTITRGLREDDLLGRLGGEEFAVLLPRTDHEEAREIAERLRANVEALPIHVEGEEPLRITTSMGFTSSVVSSATTLDELLHAADQALYEAKATGRNRVVEASVSAQGKPSVTAMGESDSSAATIVAM